MEHDDKMAKWRISLLFLRVATYANCSLTTCLFKTRKKALFLVWTHSLPTNHWPLTHTPRILTLAFFCRHTSTSCRVLAPRVCCGLWFWCKVGNGLGGPYHCNCPGQLCCPCVLEHPTPLIHLYSISSFGNCQGWIKLDRSPKALKKMLKGTNNMQKEKSTL